MLILGLDPGATTGWCLYSADRHRVLDAGTFRAHHWSEEARDALAVSDAVAIESFHRPHGGIYPATVQAAIVEGRLQEAVAATRGVEPVLYTRHEVKLALTEATQRSIVVRDDKTAWQALVLLHGEGSDRRSKVKKGAVVEMAGAIGDVSSHARAALAVAWMHARLTP